MVGAFPFRVCFFGPENTRTTENVGMWFYITFFLKYILPFKPQNAMYIHVHPPSIVTTNSSPSLTALNAYLPNTVIGTDQLRVKQN